MPLSQLGQTERSKAIGFGPTMTSFVWFRAAWRNCLVGRKGAHAMQMALAFVDLSQGRLMSAIERFDRAAADFDDDAPNAWQAAWHSATR